MIMLSLLWDNHRLTLFYMAKCFIWLEVTEERINEFSIEYMINPQFNNNKSFIEQVDNLRMIHLVKSLNLLLDPH